MVTSDLSDGMYLLERIRDFGASFPWLNKEQGFNQLCSS